jgi:hypothetical protein
MKKRITNSTIKKLCDENKFLYKSYAASQRKTVEIDAAKLSPVAVKHC